MKIVGPNDSVMKAVNIMNKNHIGSVIVEHDWDALGIITERDILKRVVALKKDPDKILCKDVMTKPLISADCNTEVADAVKLMVKKRIKKLAVTRKGRMIGILTATDILRSGHRIEEEVMKELVRFFPLEKQSYAE